MMIRGFPIYLNQMKEQKSRYIHLSLSQIFQNPIIVKVSSMGIIFSLKHLPGKSVLVVILISQICVVQRIPPSIHAVFSFVFIWFKNGDGWGWTAGLNCSGVWVKKECGLWSLERGKSEKVWKYNLFYFWNTLGYLNLWFVQVFRWLLTIQSTILIWNWKKSLAQSDIYNL